MIMSTNKPQMKADTARGRALGVTCRLTPGAYEFQDWPRERAGFTDLYLPDQLGARAMPRVPFWAEGRDCTPVLAINHHSADHSSHDAVQPFHSEVTPSAGSSDASTTTGKRFADEQKSSAAGVKID